MIQISVWEVQILSWLFKVELARDRGEPLPRDDCGLMSWLVASAAKHLVFKTARLRIAPAVAYGPDIVFNPS
jgi:hypothetical protein